MMTYLWDMLLTEYVYIIRILLCALCGMAIGFERRRKQEEAGIRTHLILAVGAGLYMIVSKYGFFDIAGREGFSFAAARIASYVVVGVGFLCSGIIYDKGDFVRGLTTAAGIWVTAAISLVIAAGGYVIGITSTLLLIGVQIYFHNHGLGVEGSREKSLMFSIYDDDPSNKDRLMDLLRSWHVDIVSYNIDKHKKNTIDIDIVVVSLGDMPLDHLLSIMNQNDYIKAVAVSE